MVPDANLMQQRAIVAEVFDVAALHEDDIAARYTKEQLLDMAIRLAEKVEAMDGWMSKGGFLPKAWAQLRK